jgi:predicted dehydrogenase
MKADMGTTIRTAVVGLGYFGRFHAKHHAASDRADLVAVCDRDGARATAISEEFGGAPMTDHREVIGKVDAVSIAVPTSLHFEVARDFIEAGIHVLVEKPMTHDVASAARLVDLAESRGVVLQAGHIERFSAAYRALAEAVTRPVFIESRRIAPWKPRATDVDVVLDLMIHDIDIVLGLVAAPVESVQALGAPVISASEDIANARLTFANGSVADITASRIADRTERRIRVFQPDSYLICDFGEHRITRFSRTGEPAAEGMKAIAMDTQEIAREDSLGNEIADFLDCIASRRRPTVDGRVGKQALEVAAAITESIRAHRARIEASLAG